MTEIGCCKIPLQVASVGRPEKPFHESSDRSKRRKTATLANMASPEELAIAAQVKLRQEGTFDAANPLKDVVEASPASLKEMKTAYGQAKRKQEVKPCTPDEALALYIEADLLRSSCEMVRKEARVRNADIYTWYVVLLAAKKCCYPYGVKVTEVGEEIPLQELLNDTPRTRDLAISVNNLSQVYGNVQLPSSRTKITFQGKVKVKWHSFTVPLLLAVDRALAGLPPLSPEKLKTVEKDRLLKRFEKLEKKEKCVLMANFDKLEDFEKFVILNRL
ncbi:unnamed protein product, partial [Darwinula stevensoni]